MRGRIYETARCPPVCVHQHGPTAANSPLQVCCCELGGRYRDIDRLLQQRRVNTGSSMLSAYVRTAEHVLCQQLYLLLFVAELLTHDNQATMPSVLLIRVVRPASGPRINRRTLPCTSATCCRNLGADAGVASCTITSSEHVPYKEYVH